MDSNKFCPNFVELPPVTFPGVPGISLVVSPVPYVVILNPHNKKANHVKPY